MHSLWLAGGIPTGWRPPQPGVRTRSPLWKSNRAIVSTHPPPSFIPVLPLCLRASHNQNLQCLQCWQVNSRCTVLSLFPNHSSKVLWVIRSPNKRRYFFLSSCFTWLVNLFDIAKTKTRELLYWKSWRTVKRECWSSSGVASVNTLYLGAKLSWLRMPKT